MSTLIDSSTKKYRTINFMIDRAQNTSTFRKSLGNPGMNFVAADVFAQVKHDLVNEISRTEAPKSSSRFKKH
jgi:hypothetical protein